MTVLEEIDSLAVSVHMRLVIDALRNHGLAVAKFDSDAPDSTRHVYIGTNNTFFGDTFKDTRAL